jgi:hypothetical protein
MALVYYVGMGICMDAMLIEGYFTTRIGWECDDLAIVRKE